MPIDLTKCWTEQPIVVIDFETCGLNPADGVVEVAACRFEHGVMTKRFTSLINPGRDIPPEATAIHGISTEMVIGAPTLLDVSGELARVCADAVPCAYNSPFDRAFLHHHITGTDCPAFWATQEWIDPMVIVKAMAPPHARNRLVDACARYEVVMSGQPHRAYTDACATGRLLFTLLDLGKVRPCSLERLLDYTELCRENQEADYQRYLKSKNVGV